MNRSKGRLRPPSLLPLLAACATVGLGCAASPDALARQRDAALDAALVARSAQELDRVHAVLAADLAEQQRKDEQIARLTRDVRDLQARLDALQATASLRD